MPGPFYFAWAGGQIQEPVTIITRGMTHGAVVRTIAAAGNIKRQQVRDAVFADGLATSDLYFIAGAGIAPGTFTIYTGGDFLNLSAPPTREADGVSLEITNTAVIGDIVAHLTAGSPTISFELDFTLPPGVYRVAGTGIGQIRVPPPTTSGTTSTVTTGGEQIAIVSAAFIRYAGGGVGEMRYLVAVQNTQTGFDIETGQNTAVITFNVEEVDVTGLATGDFAVELSGLPTGDPRIIDDVPVDAINALTQGLRYNLTGPGIQVATTFVAPPPGSEQLEIDLDATAAGIGVLLTITGPRTPNEPFDPVKHARFDEQVLAVEIEQKEGDFATLQVTIKNPNVGLLAPGRNLWCWLSWDQNWTPDGDALPDLVPLFNGRLVGLPKQLAAEITTLEFLARPDDYNEQKQNLADSLRVAPFYDPVWLASSISPDTVLEAYSVLWHVDRTTLDLTTSDILEGEDGTIEVQESDHFYDGFTETYQQPPINSMEVSGTVTWTQEGEGLLDVTSAIVGAFNAQGSPYSETFTRKGRLISSGGGGGLISCLCGDGLKSDWPKPGTSIGGGWALSTDNDDDGLPHCYIIDAVRSNSGGWLSALYYNVNYAAPNPPAAAGPSNADVFFNPFGQAGVSFPLNIYKTRMILQYKANRKRTETIRAIVTADLQQVLSDPPAQSNEGIKLTSDFVGEGVDPAGALPIGSLLLNSYFKTDRGKQSFEYLLLLARAKLRFRARAAEITFGTNWETGLGITLRNSVRIFDRRLAGGFATGKVVSYKLHASEQGQSAEFTIGCAVGRGDPVDTSPGTNSWVDDGWVDDGWQVVTGGHVGVVDEQLAYQSLDDFIIDDDGLNLSNPSLETMLEECVVVNGLTTQTQHLQPLSGAVGYVNPLQVMRSLQTTVTLVMKPVAGSEFHTDFFPQVTLLAMPKGIDLETLS